MSYEKQKEKDMTINRQPYVFISYSHDDADFAEGFSTRLQQARIPHFRDTEADEAQFITSLRRMLQKAKRLQGQMSERDKKGKSVQSPRGIADKKLLIKLVCSTNLANQEQAIEPAMRLGKEALPALHELIGHRRLDVVITAYKLLDEITHESSLPYLQAGLYPRRTSSKLRFPTAEYAANALLRYSTDIRSHILATITDQVRPKNIGIIIQGMEPDTCYKHLLYLYHENKFYKEWSSDQESIALLLQTDEDKTWPLVKELMSNNENFYSFAAFRHIYPYVSTVRRQELIDHFLNRFRNLSSWDLSRIVEAVSQGTFSQDWVQAKLQRIAEIGEVVIKRYAERKEFLAKLEETKSELLNESSA